jgi:hypothetical protein
VPEAAKHFATPGEGLFQLVQVPPIAEPSLRPDLVSKAMAVSLNQTSESGCCGSKDPRPFRVTALARSALRKKKRYEENLPNRLANSWFRCQVVAFLINLPVKKPDIEKRLTV